MNWKFGGSVIRKFLEGRMLQFKKMGRKTHFFCLSNLHFFTEDFSNRRKGTDQID